MNIDASELEIVCKGRWGFIFNKLGVDVGSGQHKCCPICSPGDKGSDRFRFDNINGEGTYFCSGCGPGRGLSLVKKVFGLSFPDTLKKVADAIGYVPPDKNKPFIPKEDPSERLNNLWKASRPLKYGDPVMTYLKNRGITIMPEDVRFCPECWEPDTKRNYFAMVAMVRDKAGEPVTLHRTYLDGKGGKANIEKPKKLMPGKKNISGCAIRLGEHSGVLSIAEGIETAMSWTQEYGVPTWAAVSAGGMASFDIPAHVKELDICGDNDRSYAGHKAAYSLAHKAAVKGLLVTVSIPVLVGDFNDVLMRKG